ncbi:hypothetical protein [Microbispora sp. H10830]|uniref:hypothetical protein n=1 Tax=Microbispora sp. H10830 TaxID=2729109 RepID=UPI0015FF2626|nr:hypothetical protein [Microbispora sp. H10830]
MRYTESDLRTLLDEHGRERDGGEPAAPLDAIVRRGRRMRRTRRAATAGAAVAFTVAAFALGNGLLTGRSGADRTTVAARPTGSAQPARWPKLPDRFPVVLGAEKFDLRPIYTGRFETVGAGQRLTFTPTSYSTAIKVACDDPRAWVVVAMPLKGGETGGSAGRCGESVGGHHDRKSAPSGWLKRPQSIQVWVFPADAPIREVACRKMPEECDESAQGRALLRPEVRDQLSAMAGGQPGRWTAAIYDRAGKRPPLPDGAPLPDAGSPFASTSTPAG